MFCKMIFSNKFGFILETVFSYKWTRPKRLAKDKHLSFFVQANNSDVKAFEADT